MTRARLADRRPAERFEVVHRPNGGEPIICFVTVSRLPDGAIGEVFAHVQGRMAKGSDFEALVRDAAVVVSIALQYGVPVSVLRHAITRDDRSGAATLAGAILDALCEER
jgi:hypothetical protein